MASPILHAVLGYGPIKTSSVTASNETNLYVVLATNPLLVRGANRSLKSTQIDASPALSTTLEALALFPFFPQGFFKGLTRPASQEVKNTGRLRGFGGL